MIYCECLEAPVINALLLPSYFSFLSGLGQYKGQSRRWVRENEMSEMSWYMGLEEGKRRTEARCRVEAQIVINLNM